MVDSQESKRPVHTLEFVQTFKQGDWIRVEFKPLFSGFPPEIFEGQFQGIQENPIPAFVLKSSLGAQRFFSCSLSYADLRAISAPSIITPIGKTLADVRKEFIETSRDTSAHAQELHGKQLQEEFVSQTMLELLGKVDENLIQDVLSNPEKHRPLSMTVLQEYFTSEDFPTPLEAVSQLQAYTLQELLYIYLFADRDTVIGRINLLNNEAFAIRMARYAARINLGINAIPPDHQR